MELPAQVVSVIVPTRNSERTLAACLASIRAQTYPLVEVVVIDNGSTDGTVATARQLADQFYSYGPVPWIATSAQRNRGAQAAQGNYLLFIDADMRLAAEIVVACVGILQRTGSPGAVIPEISTGEGYWARCRALERSCYGGDDSAEAARFFSRGAFEAAGGYDEELTALEDWDLSQRICAGASPPRITPAIVHDEGRLSLLGAAAKKRYYGASFQRLVRKHGTRALARANFIARPAFFRHWRRLLAGGVVTPGMLLLKSVEFAAAASGVLAGRTSGRLQAGALYPEADK